MAMGYVAQKAARKAGKIDTSFLKAWGPTGPTDNRLLAYINLSLHYNFKPHKKQKEIARACLPEPIGRGIKRVMVPCGRKFGKSTTANYLAHRFATYFPKLRVYLRAPQQKQAGEIYWHSGEVPNFMKAEGEDNLLVSRVDNMGMRLELINGSFIKVDGSDNFDSQRGWNPDVIIADEIADFDKRWSEVMIPNLIARDGWLIMLGTPPREPLLPDGSKHFFVEFADEYKLLMKEGKAFYTQGSAHDNPAVKPEVLAAEIEKLTAKGEHITVRREYYGEIVFGGADAIFPMFNPDIHMAPHEDIMRMLMA